MALAAVGAAVGVVAPTAASASPGSDRMVTTDGDATGLHVLVADAGDGYAWRTAATLSEPDTSTDQWIGQACVTGSGRRAVVVYEPRQFTNQPELFGRGALAAVVDLDTGTVTKLPDPVSIAYYDPGCGAGETAVLTEEFHRENPSTTRLLTVDTSTGAITATTNVPGQVTSAVPTPSGTVAVAGDDLVRVGPGGKLSTLAHAADTPFRLAVDADGGVGFEVQHGSQVAVHRYAAGKDATVLTAPARSVRLHGVAGRVFVLGPHASSSKALPAQWASADAPVDAEPSTTGSMVVDSAVTGAEAAGDTSLRGTPTGVLPVRVTTSATATGTVHAVTVEPDPMRPDQGAAPSPAVRAPGAKLAPQDGTDPSTTTIDPDRTCAIPRNDPTIESVQPTAQMSEWAADLAVHGALTVQRPAGYNGSSLPAYTPESLFPPHPLAGGGTVPAQILLGIMAQESNMWQASPDAVDGESGNFEQGGFYGLGVGVDSVDFADADCGYGATQVTTGMRIGDTSYTHDQQVALTVDYAANIAAGLEILQDKWNQMADLGVLANGGDPQYLENWWFALWAYNTGWHYRNDPSDPNSKPDVAGLGWSNNVRNSDYPADRTIFLDNTTPCADEDKDSDGNCIDAKHPNDWSYPERVMGFAAHSLTRYDYQSGDYATTFAPAHWAQAPQIPPHNEFCSLTVNQCDPTTAADDNACTRADFACYWDQPANWITDDSVAGTEKLTYQAGSAEPTRTRFYQADCSAQGLPASALVIDDVPASVHTVNGCAPTWSQHGALTFNFAADSVGDYPSKIDFHQLDTGFGGHFWLAHAWANTAANAIHQVTGTWTLDQSMNEWARVLVYVPDHGALDPQAFYTVHGSDSTSATRSIVEGNYLDDNNHPAPGQWESLGVFHFNGAVPSVSLSNITHASVGSGWADGERDVDWDAVAFQPLPAQPANQVVVLGDSYTSGEGASNQPVDGAWDYYRSSDHDGTTDHGDDPDFQDACHRSPYAWSMVASLPDYPDQTVASRLADHDPTLEYHMSACSGAVTDNMISGQAGQYAEGAQLDQGYLDQHTTVVMLSIGGNNARFQDIVRQCVYASFPQDCQNSTLDGDSAPLKDAEPARIDNQVGPAVQTVLDDIHAKAPNAKIMLMGYPRLLDADGECVVGIDTEEATWMQQMADQLDTRLAQVATTEQGNGLPVTFADPRDAFTGKAVCGSPEEIHNITTQLTRGENPQLELWPGRGLTGNQSFHPTVDGAATYATVATSTLRAMYGK